MPRTPARRQPLQFLTNGLDHLLVQQLLQTGRAKQLAQQFAVQRQRLRAALRRRRIVVVEKPLFVGEDQGAGERRRPRSLHVVDADRAVLDLPHQVHEAGQVEEIAHALAVGLEQHGEVRVAARHGQQVLRALPLLPERCPLARPVAWQKQGAGRVLPEPGGEHRRRRDLVRDQVLDLVRIEKERPRRRQAVHVGEPEGDAIVRPVGLDLDAGALAEAALQGHRPGGVDAGAEGGQDAHPPVADLVPEPLDRQGTVGGQGARLVPLLVDVGEEVRRGVAVERSLLGQEAAGVVAVAAAEFAQERAEGLAEFNRPARAVAVPEGHPAGLARSRPDDHAVAGDLRHPPGGGAQQERVARAGLVDHLLVEFAQPRTLWTEMDSEQPAVGNRAGVHPHEQGGAAARGQHSATVIPGESRAQVGELLRGIAADQHVEHRGQHAAGQAAVWPRAPDNVQQILDRPLPVAAHRDDLLRQYVERILRQPHGLDRAPLHLDRGHRALQQIAAELGKHQAAAALADRVSGTADAL